jgi:hypothetical protein
MSLVTVGLLWAAFAAEQSPASPDACAGPIAIAFEKGRLSAQFDQCPLGRVLEEVSRRTNVTLVADDPVTADPTSADFKDQPLEEGLRRLLAGYDLFSYYSAASGASSAPLTVWIYPRGSAAALRPVPPELWASGRELEAALSDPEPSVRGRAYEALMTRPDSRCRDLILKAILGDTEKDGAVRQQLFSTAIARGFKIPTDLAVQMARADNLPEIRWMALDSLPILPAVKATAQAALSDSDESVRQKAQEILDLLDYAEHQSQ